MQGQGINVNGSASHPQKSAGVMILLEGLQHDGRCTLHQWLEVGGDRNGMALRIVDCQSRQMFAVSKLLDSALDGTRRVPFQIAFHVPRETLSQYFRAALQVFLEVSVQHQNLVIRGAKRYQRDADNQRDDQSNAEQSHCEVLRSPQFNRGSRPNQNLEYYYALLFRVPTRKRAFRRSASQSLRLRHETRVLDQRCSRSRQKDANLHVRRFFN